MTMLKAARGMRGSWPWSRMDAVNAVAAAICLAAALNEWIRVDGLMTWPDVAVSVVYVAALLALPLLPVPASVTIVLVTLSEVMMPQDSWAVPSIWGLWYAMIVLAMHGLLWPALASIAVLSCLSWMKGDRLTIAMFHPSMMLMLPFLIVACMLGLGMRMWRLETRRRERAEARRMLLERENAQYRERLDLLHELHGSVAGSLAYAVLVCRQMREECDVPAGADTPDSAAADPGVHAEDARFAALREESWQAEQAVTRVLESLRREVIEPTKRLVAQRPAGGSACVAAGGETGGAVTAAGGPAAGSADGLADDLTDGAAAKSAGGAACVAADGEAGGAVATVGGAADDSAHGLTAGVADGMAGNAAVAADAQDGPSLSGREVSADHTAAVERHVREASDRLRALGFRCETLVRGDLSGLDGRGTEMVARIVDEAGNNIAKYGLPGCCAIAVTADGPARRVRVWSSNDCAGDGGMHACSDVRGDSGPSALSGGTGLDLLRRSLATVGGSLTTACEDGVWTVAATVPMAGSPVPA